MWEGEISVYVFVLKNVFGNIKFIKTSSASSATSPKKKLNESARGKITTEMSNHLFLSHLLLIVIKTVYLEVIWDVSDGRRGRPTKMPLKHYRLSIV